MARTLSAPVLERLRRDDVEIIPLLEVTLYREKFSDNPASLTLYLSDEDREVLGQEWVGLIADWGTYDHTIDGDATLDVAVVNDEPIGGVASFGRLLRHGINAGANTYEFRHADATLKLLVGGSPPGEEFVVARLVGEDVVDLTGRQATLRFSGPALVVDLLDGAATPRSKGLGRWFTSGAETGSLQTSEWNLGTGNVTVISSPVHSGLYAIRLLSTASPATPAVLGYQLSVAKTSGTFVKRTYVNLTTLPSLTGRHDLIRWRTPGDAEGPAVRIDSQGGLYAGNPLTPGSDLLFAVLGTNRWYRIEEKIRIGATAEDGLYQVRVYDEANGDVLLNSVAIDGITAPLTKMWYGPVSSPATPTMNFVIDDIAMEFFEPNDFRADFIGPGRIVALQPDTDVSVGFSRVGAAGSNAGSVSDLPPDDSATYVYTTSAGITDRYAQSPTPLSEVIPANAIARVLHGHARYSSDLSSQGSALSILAWDEEGREYVGGSFHAAGTQWKNTRGELDESLVLRVAGKSIEQLGQWHLGLRSSLGGTQERRVTSLWINLEYQDPF